MQACILKYDTSKVPAWQESEKEGGQAEHFSS